MTELRRLGVVATGESAVRILYAVGSLNAAGDGSRITTILIHRDRELRPWYGREADEVIQLAESRKWSVDDIVGRLQRARIDTLWLGACPDRTALLEACEQGGIGIVGSGADVARTVADRSQLAAVAAASGVAFADADHPDHRSGRRRLDVPILTDDFGAVWTLGCRDVSAHRNGTLLVGESPCTTVPSAVTEQAQRVARQLTRSLGIRGEAQFQFVADAESDGDGAAGGLTLLGVDIVALPDHATFEERTGTGVIGLRLRLTRGESLPESMAEPEGVAVEARLTTVDPHEGSTASAGRVALLSFPVGTGVRVDANRRVGDPVDASDPLLAVVTAWGPDRRTALDRMVRALERTSIVVDGASTNRTLLVRLLRRPEVVEGIGDEGWVDMLDISELRADPSPVALLLAAVEAYAADRALVEAAFFAAAAQGRPEQPEDVGAHIELGYHGVNYELSVDQVAANAYSIRSGSTVADVTVDMLDRFERRVSCGGRRHRAVVTPTASGLRIEMDAEAHRFSREDGTVVRAGWPALVVSCPVTPGHRVEAGDPIAVLESMKMETTVRAPFDGEIVSVDISPNVQIERGAPLLRIRPSGGSEGRTAGRAGRSVDLDGLEATIDFTVKPCHRVYGPLGDYLLGFDLSSSALHRLLTQQRRLAEIAEPDDESLLDCENGLLDVYSDLAALYRPSTEADADPVVGDVIESAENTQQFLVAFLQWLDAERAGLSPGYRDRLQDALARYGVTDLDDTPALRTALMRMFRSFARLPELAPVIVAILERRAANRDRLLSVVDVQDRRRLERLAQAVQAQVQAIADLARDVRFHFFDEPPMQAAAAELRAEMAEHIEHLAADPDRADRDERMDRLVWCPDPVRSLLLSAYRIDDDLAPRRREVVLEVYVRRYYRVRELGDIHVGEIARQGSTEPLRTASVDLDDSATHLLVAYLTVDELPDVAPLLGRRLESVPSDSSIIIDLVMWCPGTCPDVAVTSRSMSELLAESDFGRPVTRLDLTITHDGSDDERVEEHLRSQQLTFAPDDHGGWHEEELYRNLHPMLAERLELWRLRNFDLDRRPTPEDVYLFVGVAKDNPADKRLFALAEIRDLAPVRDDETGEVSYPRLERTAFQAMFSMRAELSRYAPRDRPVANRLVLDIRVPLDVPLEHMQRLARRLEPYAVRVGLEKVVVKVRIPDSSPRGGDDGLRETVLHLESIGGQIMVREQTPGDQPIRPLSPYHQKVLTAARFGSPYPFEIVRMFTQSDGAGGLPAGSWVELDLDPDHDTEFGRDDRLVPVDRPPGRNTAHIVVGLLTNESPVVPEGVTRVALLSDPTQGLGNLAEPECRRVNAALAYAAEHRLPVEWFAVSSGALIAMDSGTENMDYIALTLRRLIEFTQAGGEINIIVTGINVGGQPYWNAEATMLTHTKGILIMTPSSAMVLTGKQALDFSGAVSAENNLGIGGFDRVMGPNGQAQYLAASFPEACALLLRHYDLTYVVPTERFPRRRPTNDPRDRDVRTSPHAELAGSPFRTVGDLFSSDLNPERKLPFDMRSVMGAVADRDSEPLERWRILRDGDTSIVWDTTVGGIPVCMLGMESHPVQRRGFVPADGPPAWTSGTLFPHSSRKTARAINAASGNRPLVVLANLSGFDGSPESMRRRQLEYGAEIGRAVTNFDGPIVFVVVSRYHGGAFVVFSKALNGSMEIAAVEGSYASVIGGAPAAATVFAREVKQRTNADERVKTAREAVASAAGTEAAVAKATLADTMAKVRSEKLGEVADEFDSIHTIERAQRVGSVDSIIPASELRPYIIDALERGMAKF